MSIVTYALSVLDGGRLGMCIGKPVSERTEGSLKIGMMPPSKLNCLDRLYMQGHKTIVAACMCHVCVCVVACILYICSGLPVCDRHESCIRCCSWAELQDSGVAARAVLGVGGPPVEELQGFRRKHARVLKLTPLDSACSN